VEGKVIILGIKDATQTHLVKVNSVMDATVL